ncbi:MAG: hypothetical protein Q4A18_06150 [Rikenellaceae bacterium]|nr:hypothetical protein [Rikenellaceae bacterium]
MKKLLLGAALLMIGCATTPEPIDRLALLERNNPHVDSIDTLASLTVGNGGFAYTVDATGLQSFPEHYSLGVPLGTQSDWGWHTFDNPEKYLHEESLREYDFGHGHKELYATQPQEGRGKGAADWYRMNPHRLHLGNIGFADLKVDQIDQIDQTLDLYNGVINSRFAVDGEVVEVRTSCDPEADRIVAEIKSTKHLPIALRFPYPTGVHCDDASDWNADEKHLTEVIDCQEQSALIRRTIDKTTYYLTLAWTGEASLACEGRNHLTLMPKSDAWSLSAEFTPEQPEAKAAAIDHTAAIAFWNNFWNKGGIVDFSHCTDPRATELERRVVLSQYLLAAQCAGDTPPQETGLTYNSWFGKFHLEMIYWHQAQFALFGHEDLLLRTLKWYHSAAPVAKQIAERQGFEGLRWMKMTDPSAMEAPSKTGSFLIWQQPHLIYLLELCYRANPSEELLNEYAELVEETATFMYDFASYNPEKDRYELRGVIPAQETLRAAETINPPFELSYWHCTMQMAQLWRERLGKERNTDWDDLLAKLSPLAEKDGLYLAAETAPQTYKDIRFTSDHPAVLGAVGICPQSRLVDPSIMKQTQEWIWDNWNWHKTWGWDYPMVSMNATRLGEPENAVAALLMSKRTNTCLKNGHNFQDARLRCYLPGNGGLLTAIALMCAGWDGCEEQNPGFPKNGKWDVRWEGIKPLP